MCHSVGGEGCVDPLARRSAVRVGEDLRSVDDIGLAEVVLRHLDATLGEALLQRSSNGVVADKREMESGSDGFAGEVVFSGAKAAGEDDDVCTGESDPCCSGKLRERITEDGLEGDGNTELIEFGGEGERVRVLPVGCEHLRAN